jgi:hypothetical protein
MYRTFLRRMYADEKIADDRIREIPADDQPRRRRRLHAPRGAHRRVDPADALITY